MVTQFAKQRREYVTAMVSTVETRGAQIAALVAATYRLKEPLGAEAFEQMLQAQAEASLAALDALEEAERALAQEASDDEDRRIERDAAGEALAETLRYIRQHLSGDVDAAMLKRLGFSKRLQVERGFTMVAQYAKAAVGALEANAVTIAPRIGAPYSTGDVVAVLKPVVERAEAAQAALARDNRETQEARRARDEARAYYQRIVASAASIVEGFCRQAGLVDAAERVRPSTRRVSGRLDQDPLPEDDPAPADG